jgi:hypothetical protein
LFPGKESLKKESSRARPDLSPGQFESFVGLVADYIRAQRAHYFRRAVPMTFTELWLRFFSPADLARMRVLQPGLERVPNPPFYSALEKLGFTELIDFSTMAAITFDDLVVFHDPLTPQLIFHELVHVVQYRLLGIDEFARLYVRGYLHGGYEGTPLEVCAYQLDGRFIMGSVGFDVEAEVQAWIEGGRF